MTALNRARFTIDGSPSEDPTTGDRGFDVTPGQTLDITLELNPARVLSVKFLLPDPNNTDENAPVSSINETQQVFVENSDTTIELSSPNDVVHIVVNAATELSSYVIRCEVVDDTGLHVFERIISVRVADLRMTVPAERQQYNSAGWSVAMNEMALAIAALVAGGGGGGLVVGGLPNTGDVPTWNGSAAAWAAPSLPNIDTDRLYGRDTAGIGQYEAISLDATLEFTGSQSIRRAALTGDVTAAAGSNATAIANSAVTLAKMADIATDSLIGRDTAGSGAPEVIGLQASLEFTGSGTIQRAALTGDVTAAAGSNTLSIATGSISLSKLVDIATDSLLGRDTAGTGAPEVISVGGGLEFTGVQVLQRSALTGDITAAAGSNTTAIAAGVIVNADINASAAIALSKLAAQAALSVVMNATNASAVPTAVAAGTDHQVLRRSGTALAFGAVNLAQSAAVTGLLPFANIANGSARSVFGRAANSAGVQASIAGGGAGTVLVDNGTTLSFTTIGSAGITDNSVTLAKMQDIPTDTLLGRDTAGTGDPESISLNATLEFTGANSIQRAALTGDITAAAGSNTTAIAAGVIVDADVNASAAIAGTKINPDFGAQTIITTGGARFGTDPADSGSIRIANDFSLVWRNGTNDGNVGGIRVNSANGVMVGDASNAASVSLSTTGASIVVGTNVEISGGTQLRFDSAVASPSFIHEADATNGITADTFLIQAQNATGTTSTGGDLQLRSGTGTTASGATRIYAGSTQAMAIFTSGIDLILSQVGFQSSVSNPFLQHNTDSTASAVGDTFTVRAQSVTGSGATVGGTMFLAGGSSTNGTGGVLDLRTGTGASAVQAGEFFARIGSAIFLRYPGTVVPSSDGAAILRTYHNSVVLSARDNANSANHSLIRWGTTTDEFILGNTSFTTRVLSDSLFLGNVADTWLEVNGSSNRINAGFGATLGLSFGGGGLIEFGSSNFATSGNLRWGHNMSLQGRDNANANNRNGVRWGATTDTWQFGDAAVATQLLGSSVQVADSTTMVEVAELATNRDIVSLLLGATLTTTQMPANTGDKVVFVADATTAPTSGLPVGGSILFSSSAMGFQGKGVGGVESTIVPKGDTTAVTRKLADLVFVDTVVTAATTEVSVVEFDLSSANFNGAAFDNGVIKVRFECVGYQNGGNNYSHGVHLEALIERRSGTTSGVGTVNEGYTTIAGNGIINVNNPPTVATISVSGNVVRGRIAPFDNTSTTWFGKMTVMGVGL